MSFILLNGIVLTMEPHWNPELLDIVVCDKQIEKVAKLSESELSAYIKDGYELIDMSGKAIMPGFVNTHGHAAMTLLRSYADDLPLQEWLENKIWPFEGKLTEEDIYWGTKLAIVEMIETGTTCFADMYFEMGKVAEAVDEMGIRACLSRGLIGFAPNKDVALEQSKEFIQKWNDKAQGRISCTLGPHAPYTCPPEYLQRVVQLANELDVPLQIHISETKKEVEDCIQQYGKSPVVHLEEVGIFTRPTIAAHCVHLNDQDIEIMRKNNVKISHNPGSNLKLASGIAPIGKYLDAGITVGIGTDGCSSNNNLNMVEEMQLTALLHKGNTLNPTLIPAKKALEMATIEGAKVLYLDNKIGSIKKGKRADLIAFDLNQSHYYPRFDIASLLVYSANARDISDVYVDGVPLMKNHKVSFNKQTIFEKVESIAKRITDELPQ